MLPFNDKIPDGRILGVDYGLKRIGVAISDPTRTIASGLPTITNKGWQQTFSQLNALIEQYKVVGVVVGKPFNMDGSKSAFCDKVEAFIFKLAGKVTVPIWEWDERLTTLAAERTLKMFDQSPSKKRKEIDKLAASFILQSFLDRLSKNTD